MPTYEYECRSCSHSFEAFQSMSEDPLSTCPSCGGKVRRLIGGGTGIIFKGSGFYVNDSKKSGSSALSPASKSSSEGGGEAVKPEPAAAAKSESTGPAAPSAPPKAAEAV